MRELAAKQTEGEKIVLELPLRFAGKTPPLTRGGIRQEHSYGAVPFCRFATFPYLYGYFL